MDNYVSNLSAEMLKRAKDEFGEDEQLGESSLIAIRDWIKKQPHLVSTMNTGILIFQKINNKEF